MSTAVALPSAHDSDRHRTVVVAGLDLLHVREPDADAFLQVLAGRLPLSPSDSLATHWGRAGELAHVALSAELVDADPEHVWRCCAELLGEHAGPSALVVGDRSTGRQEVVAAARAAAAAHTGRSSGRLVRFPGDEVLVGTVTVQQVLDATAVETVRVLAGADPAPATEVVTRSHVRPTFVQGRLELLVQPAVGGTLVPFESPSPTPCCSDHG